MRDKQGGSWPTEAKRKERDWDPKGHKAERTFLRASNHHAQKHRVLLLQPFPSASPYKWPLLVLILQAAKLQAGMKAQRDLSEHVRQLLLNQLVPGQWDTKLHPRKVRSR